LATGQVRHVGWRIHRSVFAPRAVESDGKAMVDTPELLEAMFELDWGRIMSKENVVRMLGDEAEAVREELRRHAPLLYIVMITVGALGTGDVASMQLNEWTEFLNSCGIPDAASKFCKLKDCDQLFIQVPAPRDGCELVVCVSSPADSHGRLFLGQLSAQQHEERQGAGVQHGQFHRAVRVAGADGAAGGGKIRHGAVHRVRGRGAGQLAHGGRAAKATGGVLHERERVSHPAGARPVTTRQPSYLTRFVCGGEGYSIDVREL
jgi:hypothetical protein